jgi:UDP-N-acetylglucosamine transferase subunit ALG13
LIFASVGSMLPFDRFVQGVDEWARDNIDVPVFIQIGEGDYEPKNAPFARVIPMEAYRKRLRECSLFVAHVGMGSILQALEERKQMLMLPRHQSLGEHTTDHQLHTAARFGHLPGLKIVDDVADLQAEMTSLLASPLATGAAISDAASPELIAGVIGFLDRAKARLA